MKELSKNFFEQAHESIQIDQSETNPNCWYISDAREGVCLSTVFGSEEDALARAQTYMRDRRSAIQVLEDSLSTKLNNKRGAK